MKRILIFLLLLPSVLSIVDSDFDGYCEADYTTCRKDECPGTAVGVPVDDYGCSCTQKMLPSCSGPMCCVSNSCNSACEIVDYAATCVESDVCGKYIDCMPDGCYGTQAAVWVDFPESGFGTCDEGVCTPHSCDPISEHLSSECDFDFCSQYGDYKCMDDTILMAECKNGYSIIDDSVCWQTSGGSGICGKCDSSCIDNDGEDYTTSSSTNIGGMIRTDLCTDELLTEQICTDGAFDSVVVDCRKFGMRCDSGRCYTNTGNQDQNCFDDNTCNVGLECALHISSRIQKCCPENHCLEYSGCVVDGTEVLFGSDLQVCDNGNWRSTSGKLECHFSDTSCDDMTVLYTSGTEDAHVAMMNAAWETRVCCQVDGITLTHDPTGSFLMSMAEPADDGHVSLVENLAFPNEIRIAADTGNIQCTVRDVCSDSEECVFAVSDTIQDSHVWDCTHAGMKKLCCIHTTSTDPVLPGVMVAEYDGTDVHVYTNRRTDCSLRNNYNFIDIPCSDVDCTDHSVRLDARYTISVYCDDDYGHRVSDYIYLCEDGTLDSRCSTSGKYCSQGYLQPDCTKCGCPSGMSCDDVDGACYYPGCLMSDVNPGYGHSSYLLNLGDTQLQGHAERVIAEYADFSGINPSQIDTSDEMMDAVAYYVDKHMTYVSDAGQGSHDHHTQSAVETMNSGSRCSTQFCGDCEDHAILRLALMRQLKISEDCAFGADRIKGSGGHTYNVVKYNGAFRIMDYGLLGSYFVTKWDSHRTNNVWNDYYGIYWSSHLDIHSTVTNNYPSGPVCQPEWTYKNFYTDVCPDR